MHANPHYEERRGWRPSAVASVSISGLIGVLSLVGFGYVHLLKLLFIGLLFSVGGALNALSIARGRLALRADERGITLMDPTPWARTEFTPWSEVRGIVVYKPARRAILGVVKQYAGLPTESVTPGGSPKPDSSVAIDWWTLDLARLAEVVHAYAPEVTIADEREPVVSAGAVPAAATEFKQRPAMLVAAAATLLVIVVGVAVAFHSDSTDGYKVQSGPAGASASLTLPQHIGVRDLLMDDDSPLWQYQPQVLPAGPASSYGTIAGDYASFDRSYADITVDAIYAKGDSGHRGTFTLNPQALANYVDSSLFQDGRKYPSGAPDTVLECGTYGNSPMCVWATQSVLAFVYYSDIDGSLADLAALTPATASALEGS